LYAKETKALGAGADFRLCIGKGKRVLAWLTGTFALPVMLCRLKVASLTGPDQQESELPPDRLSPYYLPRGRKLRTEYFAEYPLADDLIHERVPEK